MSTVSTTISLVQYSGTIFDQGSEGSCKANQICAAIALQANEYGVRIADLSRQQLYNDIRSAQGQFDVDSGSYTPTAEKVATTIGIANESSFAYGPENLYAHPNDAVHAEAATQKVLSFTDFSITQNPIGISQVVGAQLMHGKAVLVDAYVHYGFGVDPNSFLNPINGGHAYLIVGMDSAAGTYTVQNSWGGNWANGGYGTIKFSDLPGIGPTSGGPYGTHYQDLFGLSVINGFAGVDVTWTNGRQESAALYAAVLGRVADKGGIMYWGDALQNNVITEAGAVKFMMASTEAHSLYDPMNNSQFVSFVYQNVTGRVADEGGASFYVNNLNIGAASRSDVIYDILHNVETNKDTLASHDRMFNMSTFGTNYAITYQATATSDAANNLLHTITDDANTVQVALVGVHTVLYG